MKAFWDKIDIRSFLAGTVVIGILGLMYLLVFVKVPESDMFKMILGVVLGSFTTVYGYYLGSSSGSKEKDGAQAETLKSAMQALSNNQPPKVQ